MILQTQVIVNSSQQEYFSSMDSGFPYFSVLGVLKKRSNRKHAGAYLNQYLKGDSGESKENFRFSMMEIVPWHWHEEFEFCKVIKGTCRFLTPTQTIKLNEGDAVFINANCLHMVDLEDGVNEVVYHTQQFNSALLEGPTGSIIKHKYIQPISNDPCIQGFFFNANDLNHQPLIASTESAYTTYLQNDLGYEMCIRNLLSELLLYMVKAHKDEFSSNAGYSLPINNRIKTMMTFIEYNYMDKISVEDIGSSANVSKRECLRCFSTYLHMSPFMYLTHFRIRKAMQLLERSEDSIIQISEACGFSSNSYFGKVFRHHVGSTPNEYRKLIHDSCSLST
ncbi:helix-turn-helix domain-containing protein [Fusibacter sp. 3D3]|uniref:AraC family transcriptional regulator n=1 Tax=Fusibacter sp. 3D3 TaxID=1048380 RepID=UPI000853AA40|nr:helix-turn-helix domain-containing protein [Fusibacter sp. 3D3]GAU78849.1 arginine pathway regulatory protein ArgR, repressor of arg regulon [Fusibacter sp. 3D3]